MIHVNKLNLLLARIGLLGRLAGCAALMAAASTLWAGPVGYAPDRILLRSKPEVAENEVHAWLATAGVKENGVIPHLGIRVLQVDPAQLRVTLEALSRHHNTEFAEPDYLVAPDSTPNDPYYPSQWHLPKVAAPAAWDVTQGSNNIIIAILDSGVESTHPDLAAQLVAGWNFYANSSNTTDPLWHGTAVAGTAAATMNNGIGVASVAPGCKIMPLVISDPTGYAYWSTIATGLTYAADHGARVANISYQCSTSATIVSAAQYFHNKGGVVAISAGNDGSFNTTPTSPYLLTVSATDQNDVLTTWSATGDLIDLCAPGLGIVTTYIGGSYCTAWGTSFSAPIVAGVAALVMAANPSLSSDQVQNVLKASADDLGPVGWDPQYGWGRVNAQKAVNLALNTVGAPAPTPPTVNIASPASGSAVAGTTTVSVNATDSSGISSVTLTLDGVSVGTLTTSPYNWSWNSTTVANGSHALGAVAKDNTGLTSQTSETVTVNNLVDTTPPTVAITSPVNGASITTVVTLTVTVAASDNVGVTRVALYVDGALVTTSTAAPFTTKWSCKKAVAGSHTLVCKAYDAAGNCGTSPTVTVMK